MKGLFFSTLYVSGVLLMASAAQGELLSRLGGQAVYDTDLKHTWIADANLSVTMDFGVSGISSTGFMDWHTAMDWVTAMNSANYLGFSDWRLPGTPQPDSSCSLQVNPGSGFPLQGQRFDCVGSDMGHLYNVEGVTYLTEGPFSNVQKGIYWSLTEYAPDTAGAWRFNFNNGFQDHVGKLFSSHAWALRLGDSLPPPALVPALGPLGMAMLSSLLGLAGWRTLRAW